MDKGQIKIYNSSIFDYNIKSNEFCFVVGLEILDNMPHDRIWLDSQDSKPKEISYIEIGEQDGFETLKENRIPIADCKDKQV